MRVGGLLFKLPLMAALLLMLAGCDNLSTDEITPENLMGFFLKTLCRSQDNCGVREPI